MTRRALVCVGALVLVGSVGCASQPLATEPAPPLAPSTVARNLTLALSHDDRPSFLDAFAGTEAAQFLADRLWGNLSQATDPVVTADTAGLTVTWRVPGDVRPAVDTLSADWVDSSGHLASLTPMAGRRVPLWLSDDLTVVARPGCTLIVPTTSARDLTAPCANASRRVLDAGLRTLSPPWTRTLVVEVPATGQDFASLTGTDPAAGIGVGALTQPEGTETTPGPARVVLNPASAWSAPLDQIESLLTHEGVHHAVAERKPALALWVVEGLADHVALPASPAWRAGVASRLVSAYGAHPETLTMPVDADFAGDPVTDHADLRLAYDTAWLMVDTLVVRRGREQALADLGRLARGEPAVTPAQWLEWARARIEVLAR